MPDKALLVLDMLNDFVRPGAPLEVPDTRKIIPAVKREIEIARREGYPVVYVCEGHKRDDIEFTKFGWPAHGVEGTEGAEVVEELRPAEGDIIVRKPAYSGFYGSGLDEVLKGLGAGILRLTGCVTHICVLFTAFEGAMRGYDIEVVSDGVAGLDREDHEAALRIMKNVLAAKIV